MGTDGHGAQTVPKVTFAPDGRREGFGHGSCDQEACAPSSVWMTETACERSAFVKRGRSLVVELLALMGFIAAWIGRSIPAGSARSVTRRPGVPQTVAARHWPLSPECARAASTALRRRA